MALILLSNDDGVRAEGLSVLRRAVEGLPAEHLSDKASLEVITVAPESEQSANSHSLTLHKPVRSRRVEHRIVAVDGTPADCVYVAIHHPNLLAERPVLVLSGINHGPNLGHDVHYSGTVAAAREGALRGIPAAAFSLCEGDNFGAHIPVIQRIVAKLLSWQLEKLSSDPPQHLPVEPVPLFNVNLPNVNALGAGGQATGSALPEVHVTRLGNRVYADEVSVRNDPRGREYWWIGGPGALDGPPEGGTDIEAVAQGHVSVTPLNIHATYPEHFGLAQWVVQQGDAPDTP